MSFNTPIEEKIKNKQARLGFVGLGKMGLPTALLFANAGYAVTGIDVNAPLVTQLNKKQNPYFEPGLEQLLQTNNFSATTNYALLKDCDVVLCAVPTILGKEKKPDYSIVEKAFLEIGKNLKKDALVIFESNVSPGITETLVKNSIEKSGLQHEKDFLLAYVPIQGKAGQMIQDLKKYERVVAGTNDEARLLAAQLFESIGNKILLASSIKVVELEKLFANIYKDINVAIANELAYYCEAQGIDAKEVIKYSNLIPGIHILDPGIGVGGNCLPVDPYFYTEHAKQLGLETKLAELARQINDSRPKHIAAKIIHLAQQKQAKSICLLGAAFRPNTHETAYSPAIDIYAEVAKAFRETKVYDPVVGEERLKQLDINPTNDPNNFELKILLVEHTAFKEIKATNATEI